MSWMRLRLLSWKSPGECLPKKAYPTQKHLSGVEQSPVASSNSSSLSPDCPETPDNRVPDGTAEAGSFALEVNVHRPVLLYDFGVGMWSAPSLGAQSP